MASNKDMRRADLGGLFANAGTLWNLVWLTSDAFTAIPYVDPPKSSNDTDMSSP